ncbi:MAG: N-6 DNA methylase [Candidatus Poribacteria bacterium]|nr:N-6 DNA methylase [Candidatus Poribacteria bacterium]
MPLLNLKPTHKAVKDYYAAMKDLDAHGADQEGAVSGPFYALMQHCAKKVNATFQREYRMKGSRGNISIDGAVLHELGLPFAYWEAKDIHDDLAKAVQQKREAGYPFDNILFQTPERAILFQNERETLNADISKSADLVKMLRLLFEYERPEFGNWEAAAAEFREHVPDIAADLKEKIQGRRSGDNKFAQAFDRFYNLCRDAVNPDLSAEAVEEMLIQHILTERIFRTVFNNSDFTRRNIIAREIEQVVDALTAKAISREAYLKPLDRYYNAVEQAAAFCREFSQKQHLLNAFYETFFQSFSEDVADTHGIVYTPQPIVNFMVNSVQQILETEFNRSLSSEGVHIIDPFVGTGNFIVRLMREIDGTALERKYKHELHCNEVMLLPYYIASLNIEREYWQRMQEYEPFEGVVLADTFELMEPLQKQLFTEENTERVKKQKEADMFVVIGNPPYNAWQVNDSDNNKNRTYEPKKKGDETIDTRVRSTYAADSKATNKNALSDPYVKAIRWASDRIKDEGVVAFVTNNGFLDGIALDGMRKHLADDFDKIYVLNLEGNVRKNQKLSGTMYNVFGIQVGVSVNLFIKKKEPDEEKNSPSIFYAGVDESWRKEEKYDFLNSHQHYQKIEWKQITPDKRHTWILDGLQPEFETFIPIGTKKAKAAKGAAKGAVFKIYSNGVKTNRDAWVYNFNRNALVANVQRTIEFYNAEVDRWKRRRDDNANVDAFVRYDDTKISWSRDLKAKLKRGVFAEFDEEKLRTSLYRPFTKTGIFFDRTLNDLRYVFPSIFPMPETEAENRVIIVPGLGGRADYWCSITNVIPNLSFISIDSNQCFPFYTYDEDGSNRRENITDWALSAFRSHYGHPSISRWNIFHYVYGLLHHPDYRERYEKNLKRDLPHIPFAPAFRAFASAGAELADLHVNYESAPPYALEMLEAEGAAVDWRAEKMRFSKDKRSILYNDFLTLSGIPSAALEYRLGNRSALEWVVNQYQVKTDKRSGIVNDPNRSGDPQYIVNLLRRVVSVSLRTVEIVKALPPLETA